MLLFLQEFNYTLKFYEPCSRNNSWSRIPKVSSYHLSEHTPAASFLFSCFSNNIFAEKNCWLQWDSFSGCQSRRRARRPPQWPQVQKKLLLQLCSKTFLESCQFCPNTRRSLCNLIILPRPFLHYSCFRFVRQKSFHYLTLLCEREILLWLDDLWASYIGTNIIFVGRQK